MLMTAIPAGVLRAADRHDSPIAASVQLSKSQGNMASEIAFRTMSEIASAFLPKLRNILEFIVIAAFPVVFLLVVATGAAGGIAIRAYFTLFVWLMLWAPLAVIVNYLLVHIDANPMNRLVEQFGGVTLQSADLIRDLGASSQAMAGYVMLLIPVVAFMLARASEMSASSLAASVIAPASGAAQSQSANLAMGNVSSGNASLSNVSVGNANTGKSDYSDAFTSGQVSKSTTPYGTVVRDGSTGAVTAMRVEQSNLGFTSQEILSHGEARESASTSGASTAFTQGYGYSDSKASTTTQAQGTTTIESQSRVLNQSSGSMNNNSQVKATGENVSYGESSSFGRHANTSEGLSYQSSLGLEAVAHRMGKDNVPNTEAEPIQRQETYQGILSPSSQAYLTEYPVVDSDKNIIADKRSPKQNYHGSNKKISVPGKFGFTVNSSVGHSDQSTDLSTSSNYLTESSQNIQTISAFKNTSLNDSNNISSASDNRLTNSYSDSKNGSTSFTSSKSENSALVDSERKQQTSSSVIATDRSPGILRQLNDEFSSSEEALQWLSNAENRKAFSSALLNGTIPAMDHSAINSAFAKNNSFVTQQQAEIHAQTVSEKTSNTSKNFIPLKIHPAVSLSNPSNANSISDSSFFQRGLMKLTNASFDNEAISMSGIGSLVIPAIFKYESPERRFEGIRSAAESDPILKNKIIELGKTKHLSNDQILKIFN